MTTQNVTNQPELTNNGQLLIGKSGANPLAANLTAGVNIGVTNGSGSITLSSSMPEPYASYSHAASLPGQFGSQYSDTQTQSLAATYLNNLVLFPFTVNSAFVIANMRCFVNTGVAASTITMGLYAAVTSGANQNYPLGAPLIAGQAASTSSATIISVPTVITLTPGNLYWAAIQASTATTLSIGMASLNLGNPNYVYAAGSTLVAQALVYPNVYSAGTLPTMVIGSLTTGSNNWGIPIILTST